ncbi:HNH endonuclease [Bizionia myxarmorum]|uniref:HNH nuclease domain-containing protein n=1 Tax=Bizionia myxarmorum TaxID=291186 RepID=A0A5D0QYS7_9FLAO|nr:HNH endonuclease [Bizionia myxarmorum]TYB74373.1 hypothetical protein ES674_14580 [Bizionia myxarmorum]
MKSCDRCKKEMCVAYEYENGFGKLWFCRKCGLPKYEFIECEHEFEIAKYQYESGVIHVISKCIKCDRFLKSYKKRDVDFDNLPFKKSSDKLDYNQKLRECYRVFNDKVEELKFDRKKDTNEWTIQKWYYGYLESNMWRKKREYVFKRNNYKCERCGAQAEFVHHLTYERVGYEKPEDLMSVCKSCHGKEHGENKNLNIVSQFKIHDIE